MGLGEGASAGRELSFLLWPRLRSLRNAPRSKAGQSRSRLVLFAVLGLVFAYGAFEGANWLFERFLEVEFLAELLIRRVLGIVLLFFAGLLVFSNIITAFTTFYLADDLPLLVSSPIPVGRLYLARLFDTWVQSSWMMLIFALPILAGCGPVLGVAWWFYPSLFLVLVPLTLLCAVGGSAVAMILARWLPAHRTQEVLVVLAMLGFLAIYIAFRLAEPERFLNPDGFKDLVALMGSLRESGPQASPTEWTLALLMNLARSDWNAAWLPALVLFTSAPAACALGAWLARTIYLPSFALAQEGRSEGEGPLRRLAHRLGRRRRPPRFPRSVTHAFTNRDTRIFLRTTSQWTQLLLIGALVIVYVFNFKHFKTLQGGGIMGAGALFFVNVALSGLVVTTVAVRFLYPAVSLEGRAYWAVRVAPITAKELLEAKTRWAFWPLLAVSLTLTVASNLVVGLPFQMQAAAILIAAMTTYGLTGMGVGMGATDPRFTEDNPARIASGVGGVLFMLFGLFYGMFQMLLLLRPLEVLHLMISRGFTPLSHRVPVYIAYAVGAVLLMLAAHHVPMWLGARKLEARED